MIRLVIGATVSILVLLTAWAAASTLEVDGGAAEYEVEHTPPPPEQVQGVSADVQGPLTAVGRFSAVLQEAVQVSWIENDEDEGVTEYRVYRSQDYDGDFEQIGTSDGASYTDHAIDEGETYVYYVTAVNDVGESVPSDEASAEVPVDCETLEGSDGYDEAVDDGDCPELTPTPTPTSTGEATGEAFESETLGAEATAEATATPVAPTPTGTPFPTVKPGSTAVPTGTPSATQTPIPTTVPATSTPEPSPTSAPPTQTPEPSPTSAPPTAVPTDTPDPGPTIAPTP